MTRPAYLSPEWHAERRTYLGASEFASALGLSPWGDPIETWESKVDPAWQPRPESFRMKLGILIEPLIGKLFEAQLAGDVVADKGYVGPRLRRMPGPIRHPVAPFLASSPDFRITGTSSRTGRGLVQAKLRLDEPFGEVDDGEGRGIPLHYRLQGLGELMTTGFDYVYFAALNPREGVTAYPLDRRMADNEAAIDDLYHDLVEYWNAYVIPKKVPPPSAQSAEALRRRYPEAKMKVGKIASADQSETLHELLQLRESEKAIKQELDAAKNTAKSWIGDAQWIEGAGKRFSWSRYDVTKVAHEEIAGAYRRALDRLLREAPMTTRDVLSDGFGTTNLDDIEKLYTRVEPGDRLTVGEIS